MARLERIEVDGSAMQLLVDGPADARPRPAVLLLYHREGLDDFTRGVAARLAQAGYRVAAPDISHRVARDVPMRDRKQFFRDSEVVRDMRATLRWLEARSDVLAGRTVALGHCMGGRMALLAAATLPELRGAVALYGGGVMTAWGDEPQTPFDLLGRIRCPVLGLFGDFDKNPSPADVAKISAAMSAHGVVHAFHRYADVGHGFHQRADTSAAERRATVDSWAKIFAFLETATAEDRQAATPAV